MFPNIITDGTKAFLGLSIFDRFVTIFWLLGPFILLIERSPADAWLSIIAICFVVRALLLRDCTWFRYFWVRAAFAFWAACIISALLSDDPVYAVTEAIVWFRFPIFAMATVFWLSKDRRMLNLMLISTSFGVMLMCFILSAELLIEGYKIRLSWPYDDLVPGNYLAKVGLPIIVVTMAVSRSLNYRIAISAALFAIIIMVMTLLTGERVNFLLVAVAGFLSLFVSRQNWPRAAILSITSIVVIFIVFHIFSPTSERYISAVISQLSLDVNSDYYRAMVPALHVFESSPAFGIGPGNFRYMCADIVDSGLGLSCYNHPHNFYLQLLAETGLVGVFFGVGFIFSILFHCFCSALKCWEDICLRMAWIVPLALFWPIRSNADFFGQWNNIFVWSAIALALAATNSFGKGTEASNEK